MRTGEYLLDRHLGRNGANGAALNAARLLPSSNVQQAKSPGSVVEGQVFE